MKKLISFYLLKRVCAFIESDWCEHRLTMKDTAFKCNSKDCPIWKKLKPEVEIK